MRWGLFAVENSHAFTVTLDRVWADDVELTLIELDNVLFGRVAKYKLPHIPEHKHFDLLLSLLLFGHLSKSGYRG